MKYTYNKKQLNIMESKTGKYKTKLSALTALRNDLFGDYLNQSLAIEDVEYSLDAVDKAIAKEKRKK